MVRTRFAPSPTGDIHIGNFRTALYAYMWAKKNDGEFMVRIEDTDRKRFVAGSAKDTIDLFEKYGLKVDIQPTAEQLTKLEEDEPTVEQDWILNAETYKAINDDDYKDIIIQTQRLPLYLKYALKLIHDGYAYLCFCTEDRLKELRESQSRKGGKTMYDGTCQKCSFEEALERVKNGEKYVVRLNVKAFAEKHDLRKISYEEPIYGKMQFPIEEVDDQVIIKSNGIPTYHLAVVVDDHLMGITHAMRGYGWLPSIPKQVILYEALGWNMPPYYHLTDILDPDGGKLSKRKGAVAAIDFLKEGYLPEAILNFLAFLGWTPDVKREYGEAERELYPFKELIRLFDLNGFNKSNPVFNREKLLWFNQEYIKRMAQKDFGIKVAEWFDHYCEDEEMQKFVVEDKTLDKKVALFQERMKVISELVEGLRLFYKPPVVQNPKDVKGTKRYDEDNYKKAITQYVEKVVNYENESEKWDNERWVTDVRALADEFDWKHGDMFMLIRLVICGSPVSPPLFETMQILGKKEVMQRLELFAK